MLVLKKTISKLYQSTEDDMLALYRAWMNVGTFACSLNLGSIPSPMDTKCLYRLRFVPE
jgi:hypothetical protein